MHVPVFSASVLQRAGVGEEIARRNVAVSDDIAAL
jgi:hypothetical protein